MTKSNTSEIVSRTQAAICKALDPLFPASGKFALLDFPNYTNVGDSAIWLGEIAYFKKQHNAKPIFVSQIVRHSSDEMRKHLSDGTIYINGGGNFGDLWVWHQDFREKIIKEFPKNAIVQLPVSIHFQDSGRLSQTAKAIAEHPDFTLTVRDHESLKIAQDNFSCKTILCPDMAFMLGAQQEIAAHKDLLLLLRTDSEKRSGIASGLNNFPVAEDWLNEPQNTERYAQIRAVLATMLSLDLSRINRSALRELFFRYLAEDRLHRGLKQIQDARFIITDRLHTHILSLLSDRPHIALDNSYGKIGNFMRAWTLDSNISTRAETLEQAADIYMQNKKAA